jgi:hypothetical protein
MHFCIDLCKSSYREEQRSVFHMFLVIVKIPLQSVMQVQSLINECVWNIYACRGASLRSGSLHPDTVLHREQCLKAEKKAYYSKLHEYHDEYVKLIPFLLYI